MKNISLIKIKIIISVFLIFSISPMFCQVGIGNQDFKVTLHISAKPTDVSAKDGGVFFVIGPSEFKKNYNKLSFEFASGISKPMSNISNRVDETFISAPNWNLGLRYMFTLNFGIKGSFNYDSFEEKGIGSRHNRFNLDAYYNIGNWFDLNYVSNSSVSLYAHLGAGATYVNSKVKGLSIGYIPGWERQINLNLGISPRFRMNDIMSFYTDINYIMAMKQHYNYSGEPILNVGNSGTSGSHFSFNIGLSFSIGDYDDHADFY